ncbi:MULTISPECIES: Stk1 family PASTA domain-containing Ser/Thr kinase [unclassified Parvimonas]|uniref:Stk1 family PASTA domain-containing Ser/Thr kinase n=1 Tax=unclassified Parvimonas TaxID=1151464 RepID=UPI002B46618F|nr:MULTISPECIES: Stk1 family PASTA domain-containing Ser/Thr kinase [unclassified Parvimonas]MEB3024487.1 Stk1 family PASTA domain-containing Ser/Thr kinase [Parvimonas sp. M13]MEB3072532.1 Stk1 family PASTA domain-containing Ser/Thr kinase [Parvimonas sp. C2]MEB3088683.1 Stk1 family PASTA domain-containing Ser/Thr kinase [Parvimonas sp. M20]
MLGSILNGRYEIIEKVGIGGMAIVYKAKDIYLKRIVAVKVLKEQYLEDREFIKKFVIEAQSVANLNNQNIVKIYDVGQHIENEKTFNYIVMEYIKGKTLNELIKDNGKLNSNAVVSISKQIANALDCAHKHHIIHRDIKPHNIIIDENLNVKVTDFGIARIATSSTITYTSSVLGTVHYISPEQAKGKFIDEKSDIYSLGVVMYEMITGRVPFDTDNAVGIAMQHINEPLVEPIRLVPNMEPWLNAIIVKCMEKDPENRFESAESLIRALEDKNVGTNQTVAFNDNTDRALYRESVYKADKQKDFNKPIIKNNNKNRESLKKKKGIFDYSITYVVLALLIVASVFFIYRLAVSNKATNTVKVPPVIGLDKDEAIRVLKEKKLNGLIVKTVNDDSVEAGKIVQQSPAPNAEAKEGTNVELTVSVGKNKTIVPNLSNVEFEKVEELLKKSNLSLGKVERKYDDKVDENKVISQSVNYGDEVEKGTKIDIVVSRGKEDKKVEVPDLIGKTEAEAIKALYDSGLAVGRTEKKADSKKAGTVIWQSYGKGVKVDASTKIDIVVSSGKATKDNVLNLSHYTEDDAVTKRYTINEPDKNYLLRITKNTEKGETKIYEKTMVTGSGKLTINIKAKSSDKFNIYVNGELILSGEN